MCVVSIMYQKMVCHIVFGPLKYFFLWIEHIFEENIILLEIWITGNYSNPIS